VNLRLKRIDGVYGKGIGTIFKVFLLCFEGVDFLACDGDDVYEQHCPQSRSKSMNTQPNI